MAKRYYWLKLKEDFFRNKIIKKLRKVAGGDTYVIIYLKLQLLSLNNEGVLIYDGLETTFAKELALDIDEDEIDIDFLLHFLKQASLLEEFQNNEFTLIGAVESMGSEGSSAERVRQFREREKQKRIGEPKKKRFTPPNVNDINTYCKEKGYRIDAEQFIAFYESNGWKVGKNPMKSWKGALTTWAKRNTTNTKERDTSHL